MLIAIQSQFDMLLYARTWLWTKATGTHMHHGTDSALNCMATWKASWKTWPAKTAISLQLLPLQPCLQPCSCRAVWRPPSHKRSYKQAGQWTVRRSARNNRERFRDDVHIPCSRTQKSRLYQSVEARCCHLAHHGHVCMGTLWVKCTGQHGVWWTTYSLSVGSDVYLHIWESV